MAQVVLRSLTKRFGNIFAVKEVSLEIREGELLALVGPSGCGKTTCLRLIAGLEEPDEGEVWIDGRLVNGLPPRERDVAMVFQNYALYPHMTIFDNLAFPLRMRKVPKSKTKKRVLEVAKMLDIEELLRRKPGELSGGQQQRVALGRAIVRNPKVFLMDEPLSNLDARLRVQMRSELLRLHRSLRATTIYVTHDQAEAMSMGDRIAVMREGEILQVDPPMNVYNKPATLFVASFIGNPPMNLFEGKVERKEGRMLINPGPFIILPAEGIEKALREFEGRSITLGIRPEDLKPLPCPSGGPNEFQGKVEVVEPLGQTVLVHVDAGGLKLTVSLAPPSSPKEGEEIALSLDSRKIHIFDPETERAIE